MAAHRATKFSQHKLNNKNETSDNNNKNKQRLICDGTSRCLLSYTKTNLFVKPFVKKNSFILFFACKNQATRV